MIQITFREVVHEIEARKGALLLDLAHEAGVPLRYACRLADCGTCVVQVEGEGLDPPGKAEARCLAHIAAPEGGRLACQARVMGPTAILRVHVYDLE